MAKNILEKIVDRKKEEVIEAKRNISENQLQQHLYPVPGRRSFFKALKKPGQSGVNVIAEIKRASPSKGKICENLDPEYYAAEYETGGAAALSVLTDRTFFKGSIDDFKKARSRVSIPVLRKDFLISSYQIYESAVVRADAVLLIVRILSRNQLRDYLGLCAELNLDALVEIHSREDIEAAIWAGAKLIGINNRNLSSFKTDISTAVNLVSLLQPDQIPVAASGISSRGDIDANLRAGINNFLIGESLVRSQSPSLFLKSLLHAP
ncbi:MAG TPA: indole-3-glycerol phosphate synthase TrpC [Desulfobacteraceae bacterium]|nr:indole-3-glycerol phosphate synthase TrpC [Desulfobacteraceae bacterium]